MSTARAILRAANGDFVKVVEVPVPHPDELRLATTTALVGANYLPTIADATPEPLIRQRVFRRDRRVVSDVPIYQEQP